MTQRPSPEVIKQIKGYLDKNGLIEQEHAFALLAEIDALHNENVEWKSKATTLSHFVLTHDWDALETERDELKAYKIAALKEIQQLKLERDVWERNYNVEVQKCGKREETNRQLTTELMLLTSQLTQSEKKRKRLRDALKWIVPKMHQGNHDAYLDECKKSTCSAYHVALAEDEREA